jgi:hypothetical protein
MTNFAGKVGNMEAITVTTDSVTARGTIGLAGTPAADDAITLYSNTAGKELEFVSRSGTSVVFTAKNIPSVTQTGYTASTSLIFTPTSTLHTLRIIAKGDCYVNSAFCTGTSLLKINNVTADTVAHSLALTATGLSNISQSVPFSLLWSGTGYSGACTASVTSTNTLENTIIMFEEVAPNLAKSTSIDCVCIYAIA